MRYCGNFSLSEPWVDEGLSPCFIDTVTSSVIVGFLLICGTIEVVLYQKYSTSVDKKYRPQSCLYVLQLALSFLMLVESVVYMVLQDLVIGSHTLAGYEIFTAVGMATAWLYSVIIVGIERRNALPSIPARGHGLVLLVFWVLCFIRENLAFISWWSHSYWWSLSG